MGLTAATVLVLFIIVVELYRPIVIGDAIDDYINGYYAPYIETTADAPGAVPYHDTYLTRDFLPYNIDYYIEESDRNSFRLPLQNLLSGKCHDKEQHPAHPQ